MPRSPARITRVLFALAMATGLAFGVQSAFADVREDSSCPWAPVYGEIAVSCTIGAAGDAYCDQQCKNVIGQWSQGFCGRPGCCKCTV